MELEPTSLRTHCWTSLTTYHDLSELYFLSKLTQKNRAGAGIGQSCKEPPQDSGRHDGLSPVPRFIGKSAAVRLLLSLVSVYDLASRNLATSCTVTRKVQEVSPAQAVITRWQHCLCAHQTSDSFPLRGRKPFRCPSSNRCQQLPEIWNA